MRAALRRSAPTCRSGAPRQGARQSFGARVLYASGGISTAPCTDPDGAGRASPSKRSEVGELRRELDEELHVARHVTMREWLEGPAAHAD